MPLHDWNNRPGWEGMHLLWISELLRWVRPRLPEGYRAYLGAAPLLAVGSPSERPDVGVRSWSQEAISGTSQPINPVHELADSDQPDLEIAVASIDPSAALMIEKSGKLIAAVELISPRNKDRPAARAAYLSRYLGYLLDGANLVVIDVHPRPSGFSFADAIGTEFQLKQPACPPPMAASYRVGEPAAEGGRYLAVWRRPLTVSQVLPTIPLPLTVEFSVILDLEGTYARAAADAYLS